MNDTRSGEPFAATLCGKHTRGDGKQKGWHFYLDGGFLKAMNVLPGYQGWSLAGKRKPQFLIPWG